MFHRAGALRGRYETVWPAVLTPQPLRGFRLTGVYKFINLPTFSFSVDWRRTRSPSRWKLPPKNSTCPSPSAPPTGQFRCTQTIYTSARINCIRPRPFAKARFENNYCTRYYCFWLFCTFDLRTFTFILPRYIVRRKCSGTFSAFSSHSSYRKCK